MATTYAGRAKIVSLQRARGKLARADWFEREPPEIVDVARNRSLLTTLEIDPDTVSQDDRVPQPV